MTAIFRRSLLLVLVAHLVACGPAHFDVAVEPQMAPIPGVTKAPARVALLVAPETRDKVDIEIQTVALVPWFGTYDFGAALESASWQMLNQLFTEVELVRAPPAPGRYDFVVQPRFVSAHPAYRDRSGFMDITIGVAVRQGDRAILDQLFVKKDVRGAMSSGVGDNSDHSHVLRTSASSAVSAVILDVAGVIGQLPETRQLQARAAFGEGDVRRQSLVVPPMLPAEPHFPSAPATPHFAKAAVRPDDIAVIVGIADYGKQGKDIPNVKPAYADAEGMRLYATQALGIKDGNVIFLKDATGAQMQRVFGTKDQPHGQLHDWVKPGKSRVFVYYAGHGAPGRAGGSPYLVPADADAARIEINGYALKTLYDNLGQVPAASITVVLEACFSGQSPAGAVIGSASPIFFEVKAPPVPANLTVITAGAADQMASWEPDGSHGLFTHYFLEGMAGKADTDKDGKVTLGELDRYLKETLTYFARRDYGRDQQAQIIVGKP